METSPLAVVLLDDDGRIVSAQGLEAFGLPGDVVGRAWDDIFAGWESRPSQGASSLRRYAGTSPSGLPLTLDILHPPGSSSAVGIVREEPTTLTEQQQQLCGLGELSASVAHEINNALTLLNGWLDLMRAEMKEDPRLLSILDLLMGEVERIAKLTRNLLQVARGSIEDQHELDLKSLLDEVVSLVQYEMKNSNIEIENRLADTLPPILGNSGRLKQALLNLLVNARQAMPSGGRVTITARPDGDRHITVTVEDTGQGIPEDIQNRIFSPFFTTKRDGTGLGLPLTKRIIEDHGGTVMLHSRPGAGTRFTIRLPVKAG